MLVAKSGVPIVSSDMFACYCVSVKSSCIRVFFLPRHDIHLYSQLRHKYLHLKLSGCCIHTKQCFQSTLDKNINRFLFSCCICCCCQVYIASSLGIVSFDNTDLDWKHCLHVFLPPYLDCNDVSFVPQVGWNDHFVVDRENVKTQTSQ